MQYTCDGLLQVTNILKRSYCSQNKTVTLYDLNVYIVIIVHLLSYVQKNIQISGRLHRQNQGNLSQEETIPSQKVE